MKILKKAFLSLAVCSAISYPIISVADNYVFRVIEKDIPTTWKYETEEGEWSNYSDLTCGEWLPVIETVPEGESQLQTKTCQQDRVRTVKVTRTDDFTGTVEVIKSGEEIKTFSEQIKAPVTTAYTEWNNSGDEYNCSTWAPTESSMPFEDSFTQSKACSQDKVRDYVTRRDNIDEQIIASGTNTKTVTLNSNQQAIGTGYKTVTLPDGIKGSNFTVMKLPNGSLATSAQITRMKYIVNNNKTSLWHFTASDSEVLPHLVGETIDQYSSYYSFGATTGMAMPFKVTAKGWTWADDNDLGRMIVYSYGSATTTLYDTGKQNWSDSWVSLSKTGSVPSDATKMRFRGLCYREHGSNCSAKVQNGVFTLNYDLPAKGTVVQIK